ncbi:MAG: glycosyltransferase family 2 protein [Tannerellaceae bacterium]|nr:glycosyltransferase family 2 protein [Tannerellaceae bacterium]
MKKAAVIILNWNGKELLNEFLPSVITHTPAEWADIIVADNGSTDDSLAFLQQHYPTIQIIPFEKNYGFAGGYNKAIQQIEHPVCVLLNSDVEVTEGWLTEPLRVFEKEPTVAAIQPKIKAYRNKAFFEYAGACGGFLDRYGYPFCRGRLFNTIEKDQGQYDSSTDILWASGAALFIRTNIYKAMGGLDENFFAHQEEIDLCWRIRRMGCRILCTPRSVVYHLGGATLEMEHPHKTFLNFRNNLLMLYKNLPATEYKKVMRCRFWLDYVAAFRLLVTGRIKNARAILKARKEVEELKKRYRKDAVSLSEPPVPEIYPHSLLTAYYVKGIKKFSGITF